MAGQPSTGGRQPLEETVRIQFTRLLWAGPLAVALSVAAVLLIRTVAVASLNPDPGFMPLATQIPVFDTVFLGSCAVFVFFSMGRYSLDPLREFRSLAWKVLLASFLPDVALAMLHWFGGGWPEALVLMAMHIAVWAICVTILPTLATVRGR